MAVIDPNPLADTLAEEMARREASIRVAEMASWRPPPDTWTKADSYTPFLVVLIIGWVAALGLVMFAVGWSL